MFDSFPDLDAFCLSSLAWLLMVGTNKARACISVVEFQPSPSPDFRSARNCYNWYKAKFREPQLWRSFTSIICFMWFTRECHYFGVPLFYVLFLAEASEQFFPGFYRFKEDFFIDIVICLFLWLHLNYNFWMLKRLHVRKQNAVGLHYNIQCWIKELSKRKNSLTPHQ